MTSRTGCGTTLTIAWLPDNRIDSMLVGGTRIKYDYDGFGRLVRKRVNGTVQSYFLWDGDRLAAELTGTGGKVAEYGYYPGLDNLHTLIIGTTRYWAHVDGRGNVIGLTDGSKVLTRSYVFDEWGKLIGGADVQPFNNADRARFKGALWMGPEVELYYMRNRWYEPHSGRFLSEDPAGLNGGLNKYVFAGNDPVGRSDPHGLSHCRTYEVGSISYHYANGELVGITIKHIGYLRVCADTGGGGGGVPGGDPSVHGGGGGGIIFKQAAPPRGAACKVPLLGQIPVPRSLVGLLPNQTFFFGAAVDLVNVAGATFGWGAFVDQNGLGVYGRTGASAGVDMSVALEAGRSTAFSGAAIESQLGIFFFSGGASLPVGTTDGVSQNTVSGAVGLSFGTPVTAREGISTTGTFRFLTCTP